MASLTPGSLYELLKRYEKNHQRLFIFSPGAKFKKKAKLYAFQTLCSIMVVSHETFVKFFYRRMCKWHFEVSWEGFL